MADKTDITLRSLKRHYDVLGGIEASRNRRLSTEERDALRYARSLIAVEIAERVPHAPIDYEIVGEEESDV